MSLARISQHEVEPLPRWARLALAARSVRRARGLIEPSEAQSRILDDVLLRLDQATATATADDDLAGAAAAAYTLALDNVDGWSEDEEASVITCMVAHAAAFAAEAATLTDSRQAAHLVAQSIDFAIHACRLTLGSNAEAILAAMRSDLEHLRGAAGMWSDETALPAGFFPAV